MAENSPDSSTDSLKSVKDSSGISNPATPAGSSVLENPISARESNLERSFFEELAAFGQWCGRNPLALALLATLLAVLAYFFGWFHPFLAGTESTAIWAWHAWNPEGEQGHGRVVPLIALALVWIARDDLRKAAGRGSNQGLIWLFAGLGLFVLATRCLQPRMAIASVPFLIYGTVSFVWGAKAARVIFFPCLFLVFMIPVAALEQATFRLQFIITGAMGVLANLFGIGIHAVGTTLTATDGAFNFEVAEGCSGIRSLTAMTMLTAAYVHLTQDRLWKKLVIFACSLVFAIIGNIGRIFTVVLAAKYYDPTFAAGTLHDYSGYVFFPIAVMAMLSFSKLVNLGDKATEKLLSREDQTRERNPAASLTPKEESR